MQLTTIAIIAIGVLILLFIPLLKLLKKPLKWVIKLLLNALAGYITLWFLNFLGGFVGLELPITWLSAILVGVLGVPGVVLLLIIHYIL